MTITERIDWARRDFVQEFGPDVEPFAIVLSALQWEAVKTSRLALSRLSKERVKGADVQQYASLVVMVFRKGGWGHTVGPMVVSDDCARRLMDNHIAGYA